MTSRSPLWAKEPCEPGWIPSWTRRSAPIRSPSNRELRGRLYAFGYPAAGKYRGKDLVYCAGNIFTDPYASNQTLGMTCNMTGGSSGGPWLSAFEGTNPALSSLNSYGRQGLPNMYGPKFNANTEAVYNAAGNATTSDVIVH